MELDEELYRMGFRFVSWSQDFRKYFGWTASYLIPPVCSYYYLSEAREPDADALDEAGRYLRRYTGLFSAFRGNGRDFFQSVIAADQFPEIRMALASEAYDALRRYFGSSAMLALLALIISRAAEKEQFDYLAERTARIYEQMQRLNRMRTGSEDVVFAGLFAMRKGETSAFLLEAEVIERILSAKFRWRKNVLQTVSHALALCEGSPEIKCLNLETLMNGLKAKRIPFGKDYSIVTLALLGNIGVDLARIQEDMAVMDGFLSEQRGYGFPGFSRRNRVHHAMLVLIAYYMSGTYEFTAAALVSVLIQIRQEQAAAAAAA